MQFVFVYHVIKRMLRALKVFVLLIRRRDLVKQLPGGYLRYMATSNRWFQMQLLGLLAFVLYTATFVVFPGTTGGLLSVFFLIGVVGLSMNFIRKIVRR